MQWVCLIMFLKEGGKVVLEAIDKPDNCWNSPLEVFKATLKHEQFVTSRINALLDVAEETKDRAAII